MVEPLVEGPRQVQDSDLEAETRDLPPPAPPPSVSPLESAALPPPWLLPPSASPWVR